jgi:hypothetical protein
VRGCPHVCGDVTLSPNPDVLGNPEFERICLKLIKNIFQAIKI